MRGDITVVPTPSDAGPPAAPYSLRFSLVIWALLVMAGWTAVYGLATLI